MIESKSQWPSNGGTGIRLKTANSRLINTIIAKRSGNIVGWRKAGINLRINPKNKAIAIFEAGPAKPTLAGPNFWSLKL